jgi:cytochrome d ubiquinol oxidase subunit I
VFGAPLAMETLLAFTLESTFLGMWIFGWQRLPAVAHTALLWLVAATAYLSAFWIMVANSWLQNPVGYTEREGVAYLTDFGALLANPTLGLALAHVTAAALTAGGAFMAGVSAWHFIRRTTDWEFFRRSLRLGLVAGVIGGVMVVGTGFPQLGTVGSVQPTKFGDEEAKAEIVAEWTARFGPGDYLPPEWIGLPLALMISIGFTVLWGVLLVPLLYRDWIIRLRLPLYLLLLAVPWPFVAAISGWLVREEGRQPWAAYGLLPVADAVTPVGGGIMLASFVGFTALLGALAITNWVLLIRHAVRGPYDLALGRDPAEPEPADPPALALV